MGTEILWMLPAAQRAQFRKLGDINMDGVIDNLDTALLQAAYGMTSSNPLWNTPIPNVESYNPLGITINYSDCDLNGDGKVDVLDAQILSSNFGKDVFTWMGWPPQAVIEWGIVGGVFAAIVAVAGGVWYLLTRPLGM
jgi:hypothetical protein